ncbi:MAG: GNAT family N-acetyltransferase [Beijerinckiaceae bacterium]
MSEQAIHGGYIRKLWPSDEEAFRDHLLRLDMESRHDRFAMGVSDDFLRDYAERCFRLKGSIFGYFADGELRGAGEFRMVGDDHGAAEAAFSVEHDWRRRGVGKALMERIVRAARNARVETLYMSCLATNRAMQNLARHFEADLRFETDEVTGKMVGRAPTAASLWKEIVDDAASYATAMVDLQRRAWRPRLGR